MCPQIAVAIDSTICLGDTIKLGSQVITTEGNYQETLTTTYGCDSLVALKVSVQSYDIAIAQKNDTLQAIVDPLPDTYTWYDCADSTEVVDAQDSILILPYDGTFDLEVSDGKCTELAGCSAFIITSIAQSFDIPVQIYPNPVSNILRIQFGEAIQEPIQLQIFDLQGRLIKSQENLRDQTIEVNVADLVSGTYLVQLRQGDRMGQWQIVKR